MTSSPLAKYAPALIQIAIALVGALAQITGSLTLVSALQLAILAANALVVYLVPLFGANMRSGWKTGVAVLGALVSAFIPFWQTGHITGPQVALVVLAGLQALGAHIGVQIRNDAVSADAVATVPAAKYEPPTVTTMQKLTAASGGEYAGPAAH